MMAEGFAPIGNPSASEMVSIVSLMRSIPTPEPEM